MTKPYSLKNALEQFQEELTEIDQNPGVNQDEADLAEDDVTDDLHDSSDLSEDISTLATASESLESLAQALDSDMFPNHAASRAELYSVKFALESYGLEDEAAAVKEGDTKGSLKDRIVKGARAIWDWLVGIGKKIASWVSDVFTRITKPVMMYEKRMAEVVKKSSNKINEVSGDKYAKHLGGVDNVASGIKDLAKYVTDVAIANSNIAISKLLVEISEAKDSEKNNAIPAMFFEFQKRFIPLYPNAATGGGGYSTNNFIGGNSFSIKIGDLNKIVWEHKWTQDKETKGPGALTSSDLKAVGASVAIGVQAWKRAQKSIADMKIEKVADEIKRIGKANKNELSDYSKAALRVMPGILKSPAVDAILVITRVMGAAVSFSEAHVSTSAKEHVTNAGSSIKNGAINAGNRAKDAATTAADRVRNFRKKPDDTLAAASAATTAASNAAKDNATAEPAKAPTTKPRNSAERRAAQRARSKK